MENKQSYLEMNCPNCGKEMKKGKFGPYCSGKCGFMCGKAFGKILNDDQITSLFHNEEILLEDLVSKKSGKTYSMLIKPVGLEDFTYTNSEGESKVGTSFKFETRFPDKNASANTTVPTETNVNPSAPDTNDFMPKPIPPTDDNAFSFTL